MDDPSVDVTSKGREELLAELHQLGIKTTQTNIARLRNLLRNALMDRHPIHEWLCGLPNEQLKNHHQLCFGNGPKRTYERMRKEIAAKYLKIAPQAPLSTLRANLNGHFYRLLKTFI